MHNILTSKGTVTSNTQEILAEFTSFYEELYEEIPVDIEAEDHVLSLINSHLGAGQANDCSLPYKVRDIKRAIQNLPSQKSPGSDGIPVEFYKSFSKLFLVDLFEVFNEAILHGELPQTMRNAIIRTIPKKGDISKPANWRPISLLNADYKIFAKCIANKISPFLPFVVSSDQTANIKGRKIAHNTRLLRDFVFLADSQSLDAFLISIDQMKAFDRVNWSFLGRILQKLNFPQLVINSVKTLYHNINSNVLINGFLSNTLYPTQGVRQGCPLSPLLYIIFSEALNAIIVSRTDIRGPDENGLVPLISQYADDTCIGAI